MPMQDWKGVLVNAMAYNDPAAQARAATLMKLAADSIFKELAEELRTKHGKEIKAALHGLRKAQNPTADISNAGYEDVVRKVLIAHDMYPYPELVHGILGSNPYQTKWVIPDYVGDQPNTTDTK